MNDIKELYLATSDDLLYEKVNLTNDKGRYFDFLEGRVTTNYEYLHAINFNKVVNTQNEYSPNSCIDKYEDEGSKFLAKFFLNLADFNEQLFQKIKEAYPGINSFDCIILPESANEQMRIGIYGRPKNYYKVPVRVAKKSNEFQASIANGDHAEIEFTIPKEVKHLGNILVLDDCKSGGVTIEAIVACFEKPKLVVHAYYLQDKPKKYD